jgi:hypothetical protein
MPRLEETFVFYILYVIVGLHFVVVDGNADDTKT